MAGQESEQEKLEAAKAELLKHAGTLFSMVDDGNLSRALSRGYEAILEIQLGPQDEMLAPLSVLGTMRRFYQFDNLRLTRLDVIYKLPPAVAPRPLLEKITSSFWPGRKITTVPEADNKNDHDCLLTITVTKKKPPPGDGRQFSFIGTNGARIFLSKEVEIDTNRTPMVASIKQAPYPLEEHSEDNGLDPFHEDLDSEFLSGVAKLIENCLTGDDKNLFSILTRLWPWGKNKKRELVIGISYRHPKLTDKEPVNN